MPAEVRSRGYGKRVGNPRKKVRRRPQGKPIRVPVPGVSPQRSRSKPPPKRPKAAPYSLLDKRGKKTTRPAHVHTRKQVKRAKRQTREFRKRYVKIPRGPRVGGVDVNDRIVDRHGRTVDVDRTRYMLRSRLPEFKGDTATQKELTRNAYTALDKRRTGLQKAMVGGGSVRLALAPYHVARATVEDPGKVLPATARGARDMIVGLPSAAVKTATDPKGALKELTKDYSRRYGPLVKGDTKGFRERIKKEGAASEILDIGGAAAVEGRVAGALGAKSTRKARPKLKRSGGPAAPQRTSKNANTAMAQHALDRRRRKVSAKRQKVAAKGGRVPALDVSLKPGEVAPLRRKQVLGDRRVARRKSQGVQAMKAEQGREVHKGATRALAGLDKHERKAFKYAMQLGIRDPKAATAALARHREMVARNRAASGVEIPPSLRKTNDELAHIDELLKAPDRAFTPRLAKVAEVERQRGNRVQRSDPGLATEQALIRRYTPQAEHLGVIRREGERTPQFVRRVREEAKKQGLERPAYFASQKRPTARYSDYALGGTKAVAEDKHRYTGKLFREGREDIRPEVHAQALAKNIKRKHNWNTVADNFDANAFDWGKNKTISEQLDLLDKKGIDPGDVAFYNPRKFREARKGTEDMPEEAFGDDIAPPGLHEAVNEAATTVDGLSTKGADFKNTSGWSVIPKQVYDEIHADTSPSNKVARSWDVVKGKQSRILLGTNPPWLAFQVGSNTMLTGLAKTGPIDAVKAQVWWRKLDPKTRAAVEPYVGVGPHHVDVQQTKLGASANGRLVNAYRAFKQTPALQRASKANPLNVLFRADNAQNNFFRRSVLYSQAKRDAYNRMGRNMGKAAEFQERVHGILTLGPKEQIEAVLKNKAALEQHAAYVNRMLGDYMTYTAKERRILGRSVMFYGFLRFSLNFAFHTMPIHHPVMTALIGNLSKMQTAEVRDILGGDELPFALGRIYVEKDGKLQVVDLTRLNPASNTLVEGVSSGDPLGKVIGMAPPIVGTAVDLAYGKSAFKRRNLRVKGETGYGASEREAKGLTIGSEEKARIALERLLTLAYPYRAAEKVLHGGEPLGDDTLLWDARPTRYKRPDIKRKVAKRKAEHEGRRNDVILEQLAPFLPRPTIDPEFAGSIRARRAGKRSSSSSSGSWVDSYGGGGKTLRKKKSSSWVDSY